MSNTNSIKRFDEHLGIALAKKFLNDLPSTHSGELYFSTGMATKVQVRNGRIESITEKHEEGMGIRVLDHKGRMAFISQTDICAKGIKKAWQNLQEALPYAPKDPHLQLHKPEPQEKQGPLPAVYDFEIATADKDQLLQMALDLESKTKQASPLVNNFEENSIHRHHGTSYIFNTHGLNKAYSTAIITAETVPMAEKDGQKEVGYGFSFARKLNDLDLNKVAVQGADRATRKLGAKSIATGQYPVVLEQEMSASLISALLSAFYGKNVWLNKSLFKNKLGQKIAADHVQLINDPSHEQGSYILPIDDEGLPVRKTQLIENGELKAFLHNLYSAHALQSQPTASGMRGYGSLPGTGPANCYFQPGTLSKEQIIQSIDRGIFVDEMMGLHTINPVSGDFSVGMSGQFIQNGVFAYPVSGLALAGNIQDLLFSIDQIGTDLKFFLGGLGGSTILLDNLSISGT